MCKIRYELSSFGTDGTKLNMALQILWRNPYSDLFLNWQCGRNIREFPFSVTRNGHYVMDVMLPPVAMLTVLHSLISKGSLWLCVCVCFPEVIWLFYWTDWAGNGIHSICCTWISQHPLSQYIYTSVSGKVALMKLFLPFVHLRFLYIVFAARPVELLHWT